MLINTNKPLRFLKPVVFTVKQTNVKTFEKDEKLLAEPFIGKNYIKFNSNSGWMDHNLGLSIPAFSHYTYHISDGDYIVVDI